MAYDAYKYEVYSEDGQTYKKTDILRVMRSRDTTVNCNISARTVTNAILFDAALQQANSNLYFSNKATLICDTADSYDASINGGFLGVFRGANYNLGSSWRMVFNNGSYIIVKYHSSGATTWYDFYYYTSNNTLQGKYDSSSWQGFNINGSAGARNMFTIPFPLRNAEGNFSVKKPRGLFMNVDAGYTPPCFGCPPGAILNYNAPYELNIDLTTWIDGITPFDEDDPYSDIPDSTPSGPPDATGIPDNDPIEFPDLPTVSASDTGFVTLFNPTLAQVKSLADYMWTGLFDVATYKKLFADPMDCLLGFNMLPVSIPHGSPVSVRVGNISTGVQMNQATSQWVEVDCGTLNVGDAFGNYLSYSPYTKFSMYLPYIGIVELSTDDVMGKTLALKYHVDVLSCSCVAYLKCGASILYQFTGSCGYSIPVNGNDFRSTIANIVSITATIGGAIATGGMTAPLTGAAVAKGLASSAGIASNVMNSKPQIHRSGAIGGSAGILGMQKPYLIAEYPNPCKPKKQYHYTGYPSFVTVKLSDVTGFTAFEEILVEGVPCTEAEQTMIKNLCREGIFL